MENGRILFPILFTKQHCQCHCCICSKVLTGATLLKLTGWNRSRTLLVYVLHASFALPAAHTPSRKVFEVPASLCGAWHDQSLRDCVWDGLNTWYGSPCHYCAFILPRFHATVVRAHSSTPDSTWSLRERRWQRLAHARCVVVHRTTCSRKFHGHRSTRGIDPSPCMETSD